MIKIINQIEYLICCLNILSIVLESITIIFESYLIYFGES